MFKRPTFLVAVYCVFILILWFEPSLAQAEKSYKINDADIQIKVTDDMTLQVTEALRFQYSGGSFSGAYRDIPLTLGSEISNVQVSSEGKEFIPGANTQLGSFDKPFSYGVENYSDMLRIVWHYPPSSNSRTFQIKYDLKAAIAYKDIVDINLKVWGDQWNFRLNSLEASIQSPGMQTGNKLYRVWGHPLEVEGKTERNSGEAKLFAKNIPSNTWVEMRVVVPRSSFESTAGALKTINRDGLKAILAEEKAFFDDYNSDLHQAQRWIYHHRIFLALIGLIGFLFFYILILYRVRETASDSPTYLSVIPDTTVTPAEALNFSTEGEGDSSANLVLATLLDLSHRGYYKIEMDSSQKFEITKAENRPDPAELKHHEILTLAFFDDLILEKSVDLENMHKLISAHSVVWRTRWNSCISAIEQAGKEELNHDLNYQPKLLLAGFVFFLYAALMALTIGEYYVSLVGWTSIVPSAVLMILVWFMTLGTPKKYLTRMDPATRKKQADWQAFRKWTRDFPKLDEAPPASLILWERILIYATAFGTAKQMAESAKFPKEYIEKVHNDSGANIFNDSYILSVLMLSNLDNQNFDQSFAARVAPVYESSSSGSSSTGFGGGFGGGGGGGFGGGGGGAW
jgi:uncharacterized membrane protein